MKNKVIIMVICLITCTIFCTSIFAVTKADIIGYVNNQSVCGDAALFNSYKSTFTRLLNQKKLSDSQLSTIYAYLQTSVGILNSKGVCKISDLSKLTEKEKSTVIGSLSAGAGIITNAPFLVFEEEENTSTQDIKTTNENKNENKETNIAINTEEKTVDIYENGVLVDKITLEESKMTYTGPSVRKVVIIAVCIVVFVISLIFFILLYKKHSAKLRFIKNFLMSFIICSFVVFTIEVAFGEKIEQALSMINLMSFNTSNKKVDVKLDKDGKITTYPSYGNNYGTLEIKELSISQKIYYGDSKDILNNGIGHTTTSKMPTEGETVIYSTHNKEGMLGNLKGIKLKDKITVETDYATCTYSVVKISNLNDTDVSKLTKKNNKETLILYTCYPFDTYVYTNKRFVVFANLDNISWK